MLPNNPSFIKATHFLTFIGTTSSPCTCTGSCRHHVLIENTNLIDLELKLKLYRYLRTLLYVSHSAAGAADYAGDFPPHTV